MRQILGQVDATSTDKTRGLKEWLTHGILGFKEGGKDHENVRPPLLIQGFVSFWSPYAVISSPPDIKHGMASVSNNWWSDDVDYFNRLST